jgi:hypothetical protein
MLISVSYHYHHARAALGVDNDMFDTGEKLGGLLFDVGSSFSDVPPAPPSFLCF